LLDNPNFTIRFSGVFAVSDLAGWKSSSEKRDIDPPTIITRRHPMAATSDEKFVKVTLSRESHRRLRQIATSTYESMMAVANREMARFIRSHPVTRVNEEWEQRGRK
jgi:hypothetical protein